MEIDPYDDLNYQNEQSSSQYVTKDELDNILSLLKMEANSNQKSNSGLGNSEVEMLIAEKLEPYIKTQSEMKETLGNNNTLMF